jgi:lysophospholipase L1-like esterase
MTSPVKVGRGILALLVFGLAVELWARIDDYVTYAAPVLETYNTRVLYTNDTLGQRGKPNARYRKWELNELGFRGPPLKPDRFTLVTFGASETFGLYESEGKEYPRQLEQLLNRRYGADAFQVVNVAYPGESAHTAGIRAPEVISVVHPRVAIIYPTPADYIWLPFLGSGSVDTTTRRQAFEWRIGEQVRTLVKSALPEVVQTKLREREIRAGAARFPVVMSRLPERNIERYHDDVTSLVRTLKADGVVPVLVTHASALGTGASASERQILVSWRKFYPMLREDGFIDMEQRMNETIRRIGREQQVQVIDAAREIPPARQNFADFVHFTNQGASLMATALADGLRDVLTQNLNVPARSISQAK